MKASPKYPNSNEENNHLCPKGMNQIIIITYIHHALR